VHFWELWNEANWGPSLVPQYDNSSVPVSAKIYRGLLDAGWNALQATGHGGDTIVDSSLSQDGSSSSSVSPEIGTTAPLIFVRTLYCADSSYNHLSGSAAGEAGCPTTPAGYQQFKADNPALFQANGVGVHPYAYGGSPTHIDFPSPDGAEFAEIPQLITALDRVQQLYSSSHQMAAYNTEYGYRTRPNDTQSFFTTPDNAAAYINQAEYLSWKNSRIATYDQYELNDVSWFPTGLLFAPLSVACPGAVACRKPSFNSYRLPVWLPVTAVPRGHATEVWGHARPAYFAHIDTGEPQSVQIQWAAGTSDHFRTVATAPTSSLGYFDTKVKFPGDGQVRLAWEYPPGDAKLLDPLDPTPWIYSRVTNVVFYKDKASGYLRGVFTGHTKLGLTVKRGKNAPSIQSISVLPPRGLKFKCVRVKHKKNACVGLKLRGGKVKSAKVTHGKFLVSFAQPASKTSITGVAPVVHATGGLRRELRKHKGKTTFKLVITDANGVRSTIRLKLTAK
jgi:hypothetical protein